MKTLQLLNSKNDENDEMLKWINEETVDVDKDFIIINILGNVNVNNYNGILTPQILVKEYELI